MWWDEGAGESQNAGNRGHGPRKSYLDHSGVAGVDLTQKSDRLMARKGNDQHF